jgi:hypothetical protein
VILQEPAVNDSRATRSLSSKHTRLNTIGVIVLLLGLVGACIVYAIGQAHSAEQTAGGDGSWQDGSLSPTDSKSFSHDVQMNNGVAGVLVMKWWDLRDELKRPGPMAIMIAAGSAVVACGCFLAAKRG